MPHNSIEQTLSTSRFSTYRNAIIAAKGEDCPITALRLYEWNAQLASRFFFPLHIYEVALRNAISEALSKRYGQDWPTNTVFVNSLTGQDRHTLNQALSDGYNGVGKLLPELKFVFFENLLTKRHDGRIWKPYINGVFPHAPVTLTAPQLRKRLKDACYVIRKFRNRCGHHEPVFGNQNLNNIMPYMSEAIKWRCIDTYNWFNQQETVSALLAKPII
ncbi:hypothetical protein ABXZ88_003228 [Vibrio fluvialis]